MKKVKVDYRKIATHFNRDFYFCVLVDDCIVFKSHLFDVALMRAEIFRSKLPDYFEVSIARVWKYEA